MMILLYFVWIPIVAAIAAYNWGWHAGFSRAEKIYGKE